MTRLAARMRASIIYWDLFLLVWLGWVMYQRVTLQVASEWLIIKDEIFGVFRLNCLGRCCGTGVKRLNEACIIQCVQQRLGRFERESGEAVKERERKQQLLEHP